ncbi:MAG TPA: ROK family protein, partial [Caulobacteraceae bacterium]
MNSPPRLGVDFGGTKIEAAALGPDGTYRARRRIATPGGYDATLRALRDLISAVEAEIGETGTVGVG